MFKVPEKMRVRDGKFASSESYGNNGMFLVGHLMCIASDGVGWEHVSISRTDRCPTWDEMCGIKELFWDAEDCVVQYHPPKSEYINKHPYCLHLWRPIDFYLVHPDSSLVG